MMSVETAIPAPVRNVVYGLWLRRGKMKRNDGKGVFGWVRVIRSPRNVPDEETTGYEVQFVTRYAAGTATKFMTRDEVDEFAVIFLAKHPDLIGCVDVRVFGIYGASSSLPMLGCRDLSGMNLSGARR